MSGLCWCLLMCARVTKSLCTRASRASLERFSAVSIYHPRENHLGAYIVSPDPILHLVLVPQILVLVSCDTSALVPSPYLCPHLGKERGN